ncbi:MAG: dTMP kinase [Chloroflexota bacterium]
MITQEAMESLPGRLFIVEGIDGSGKSTQVDLLHKWLVSEGYLVLFSEWNSSPIVKQTTKRGKKQQLLSPRSFSLIHAADFANRFHEQIVPALHAGVIVLADRYVYTAYARDAARGVERDWLRHLYSFAVEPTLGFYFDVPLDEAINRISTNRDQLKFYEAGMDLGLSDDPAESFRLFQGRIKDEYDKIVTEYELTRVDATRNLVDQQHEIREMVKPYLNGVLQTDVSDLQKALADAGLTGRYLGEQDNNR